MSTSIDACADFSRSREVEESAKQERTEALSVLKSAGQELIGAKAAADASWNPFSVAKRAYKAATQRYEQAQSDFTTAQSQVMAAQGNVQANKESQLEKSARENGDVKLLELINKRQQLSGMLGTLRAIQNASEQALSAKSRADGSRQVADSNAPRSVAFFTGAPGTSNAGLGLAALATTNASRGAASRYDAVVAEHYSTMVQLANQFNQHAESVGVPSFKSPSAEGIGQELDAVIRKVSAALQETIQHLDADYQALSTGCR